MATVSTYLNFARETEAAFTFYRSVFGTDFGPQFMRFGDIPPSDDMPPIADGDTNLIMHISLPILGGHVLHGTDAPESMGFTVERGNGQYIMLEPDSREEADRLFAALSEGGSPEMPMADQFWGDYFGSLVDKFGIRWMVNCLNQGNPG